MGKCPANQLSLDWLRYNYDGWTIRIVEHWHPVMKIRQDFAGFADILAIGPAERPSIALQATSAANQSKRLEKLKNSTEARQWALNGNTILVHGWRLKATKPKGKKYIWHANTWSAVIIDGELDFVRLDK